MTSVLVAVVAQLKEGKRKDLVAMQNKIMQVGVSWGWACLGGGRVLEWACLGGGRVVGWACLGVGCVSGDEA